MTDSSDDLSIGRGFMESGNPAMAEIYLRDSFSKAPDNLDALRALSNCLQALGKGHEAVQLTETFADDHPRYLNALALAGDRLREGGEINRAKARYRQALDINPSFGPALTGLGLIALNRGPADELDEIWSKIDRNYSSCQMEFLRAHIMPGRKDRGVVLERLRDIEPSLAKTRTGRLFLAYLLYSIEEFGEAARISEEDVPASTTEFRWMVDIRMRAQDWVRVISLFEGFRGELTSDNWYQIGSAKFELGDYVGALKDYKEAIELGCTSHWLFYAAATAADRLGHADLARQLAVEASTIQPSNQNIYDFAKRLCVYTGKFSVGAELARSRRLWKAISSP